MSTIREPHVPCASSGDPGGELPSDHCFVGRAAELTAMNVALTAGHSVVLCGSSGMGTTTLACEFARLHRDDYPGGQFLIPCADAADPSASALNLAPRLDVKAIAPGTDAQSAYAQVYERLVSGARSLVIFDNVRPEAMAQAGPDAPWLKTDANLHVVATTQAAPSACPGRECLELGALSVDEALELLAGRRRSIAGAGAPSDDELAATKALLENVERRPLAVNLIGVCLLRSPKLSVAEFAHALGDDLSLPRLIEAALAALAPVERRALEFAACFAPEAVAVSGLLKLIVEEALGPDDASLAAAQRVVDGLLALRMLAPADRPEIVRLHPLLAEAMGGEPNGATLDKLVEQVKQFEQPESDDEKQPMAEWALYAAARLVRRRLLAGDYNRAAEVANWLGPHLARDGRLWQARTLLADVLRAQRDTGDRETPRYADTCRFLGLAEYELGQADEARKLLALALAIDEATWPEGDIHLANVYADMAVVENARDYPFEEARYYRQAFAIWEAHLSPDDVVLAKRRFHLAKLEQALNQADTASAVYQRVIQDFERLCRPDYPDLAEAYRRLGEVESDRKDADAACSALRKAIELYDRMDQPDKEVQAECLRKLGLWERTLGHLAESSVALERAATIVEDMDPPNPWRLGRVLSSLADCEASQGHLERALLLDQKAMSLFEQCGQAKCAKALEACTAAADVLRQLGRLDEARALLQHVVALDDPTVTVSDWNRAARYRALASIEHEFGRYSLALEWIRKAIVVCERIYAADDPNLAVAYNDFANAEHSLGHFESALELFSKVMAIWQKTLGADHHYVGICHCNLGSVEMSLGHTEQACDHFERALAIEGNVYDDNHPTIATIHRTYAQAELARNNLQAADAHVARSRAIDADKFGVESYMVARDDIIIAKVALAANDWERAQNAASHAVAVLEQQLDEKHNVLIEARWLLAKTQFAQAQADHKDVASCLAVVRGCYARCKESVGVDHPQSKGMASWLADNDPEWHAD